MAINFTTNYDPVYHKDFQNKFGDGFLIRYNIFIEGKL